MTVRFRQVAAAAIAAGLALTLAACGGSSSGSNNAPNATQSTATHNQVDVTFAQGMIPHHAQALTMATEALDKATDPAVKDLARRIQAAQDPEITTMSRWLEHWGEDVPQTDMDMSGDTSMNHSSMPGMMTDQQMTRLSNATGTTFDRLFLTLMVEHHTGAIEMALAEQKSGSYPDAIALAGRIITAQQAEVNEMRNLLK